MARNSSGLVLLFQSTLSVRRATEFSAANNGVRLISIHALREESDSKYGVTMTDAQKFQSTLSVRRATQRLHAGLNGSQISIHALREESDLNSIRAAYVVGISIHALREESDSARSTRLSASANFNPRSP